MRPAAAFVLAAVPVGACGTAPPPRAPDVRFVAEDLCLRAARMHRRGDYPAADALLREAVARAAAVDQHALRSEALRGLALLRLERGEPEAAEGLLREARGAAAAAGDRTAEAAALDALAQVSLARGLLPEADSRATEATAIAREADDLVRGRCSRTLGRVRIRKGDWDGAEEALEDARAASRGVAGREPEEAATLADLARVAEGRGDLVAARERLSEAIELNRRAEHVAGLGAALAALSALEERAKDLEKAVEWRGRAFDVRRPTGLAPWIREDLEALERLETARGRADEAARWRAERERLLPAGKP